MSVLLRRTTRHPSTRLEAGSQLSEVFVVNASKFTSARIAANDESGRASATAFVFTLDNGERIECLEVRGPDGWEKLTPAHVSAIVDGRGDELLVGGSPTRRALEQPAAGDESEAGHD